MSHRLPSLLNLNTEGQSPFGGTFTTLTNLDRNESLFPIGYITRHTTLTRLNQCEG